MANIVAVLEQQILDVAQRQWVPDVHFHRQTDHLGRRVEAPERVGSLAHFGVLSAPFLSGNFSLT